MAYQYDVFISYRRDDLTKTWIQSHFKRILESHIFYEIGRRPEFYIDEQLETGTTWPIALGHALAASRTIIALWSKTYLNSIWCTCEITHMLQRESKNGYRTIQKPGGLIFPTIIHDGESMPVDLSTIQRIEIQDCFNVRMSSDSPKAELLSDKLKPLAISIAKAIDDAPAWQADWNEEAIKELYNALHIDEEAQQQRIPKFTNS